MSIYTSCSISLYCDNMAATPTGTRVAGVIVAGPNEHVPGEFPVLFSAKSDRYCRQKAREAGWQIFANRATLCPRCPPSAGVHLKPRI